MSKVFRQKSGYRNIPYCSNTLDWTSLLQFRGAMGAVCNFEPKSLESISNSNNKTTKHFKVLTLFKFQKGLLSGTYWLGKGRRLEGRWVIKMGYGKTPNRGECSFKPLLNYLIGMEDDYSLKRLIISPHMDKAQSVCLGKLYSRSF